MAKKIIRIAPSLLAADFLNLEKEMNRVMKAKADWIHLDIMDGNFVPNISYGGVVVSAVSEFPIFKDVHLMVANPFHYINEYIDYGADLITFHLESVRYKKDVHSLINLIHEFNRAAGISIKPSTPVEDVLPFLKDIDVILVMSVEPGFGGQKFMESSIEKVSALNQYIIEHDLDCYIEVDGGINASNAKSLVDAGADVLVSGSFLFKGDMKENIKALKK